MDKTRMVIHKIWGLCRAEDADGALGHGEYYLKVALPDVARRAPADTFATANDLVQPEGICGRPRVLFDRFCSAIPGVAWVKIEEGEWTTILTGHIAINGRLATIRVPISHQLAGQVGNDYLRNATAAAISHTVATKITKGE